MSTVRFPLDERLPPDVVVGGSLPWNRYWQYPVFSRRWLLARTLPFAIVIGGFALLIGLSFGFSTRDARAGLAMGLYMFTAFMVMATAGPALATWVRYRGWPRRRERAGVVLGVLLGLGASFAADWWASSYIERRVTEAGPSVHASTDPARPRAPGQGAVDVEAFRARIEVAPPVERYAALAVNVVVLLAIYSLFGGALSLRAYFSEQRRLEASERRHELERAVHERRDAEMRLGVLQAQVEPHFLFNTLAAVRARLRDQPAQAEATLDALVAFLRASIPRLRDGAPGLDSTLGDQLDLCAHYLDVMRLRSAGRIDYTMDVDVALRALPFPPLLLITLVENAVKHGLEPKPGPGRVAIRAACAQGRLRVEVADDGVGLRPHVQGGGLGLENVRAQLRARHGAQAVFVLQACAGGGTLACIDLPAECP